MATAATVPDYLSLVRQIEDLADAPNSDPLGESFLDAFQADLRATGGDPKRVAKLPDTAGLRLLADSVPAGKDLSKLRNKLSSAREAASMARQAVAVSRIEMAVSLCNFMEKCSASRT